MAPSEFWGMHPDELHWYLDAKREEAAMRDRKYAGMTEAEVAEIYEETYGED